MHALLRTWSFLATLGTLVLLVRGAWIPAAALFILSPAPVWLVSRARFDDRRQSYAWLAAVAGASLAVLGIAVVITYFGGIPQVHEWRAALQRT
jgi:hypothetical protein